MISNEIKEATKVAHQKLEKTVVMQLKSIRSEADYAAVLKNFYAYFNAVEKAIQPYMTAEILPDYADRRNSAYIKRDIEDLGGDVSTLPVATAPTIDSVAAAFGALYVLEGSIMGGPYIVQMLKKYGMNTGFSFFSGYGEETGQRWASFTEHMDNAATNEEDKAAVIAAGQATFECFEKVFEQSAQNNTASLV